MEQNLSQKRHGLSKLFNFSSILSKSGHKKEFNNSHEALTNLGVDCGPSQKVKLSKSMIHLPSKDNEACLSGKTRNISNGTINSSSPSQGLNTNM